VAVPDSESSLIAFPPADPSGASTDPRLHFQQPAGRLFHLQVLVHVPPQAAVIHYKNFCSMSKPRSWSSVTC